MAVQRPPPGGLPYGSAPGRTASGLRTSRGSHTWPAGVAVGVGSVVAVAVGSLVTSAVAVGVSVSVGDGVAVAVGVAVTVSVASASGWPRDGWGGPGEWQAGAARRAGQPPLAGVAWRLPFQAGIGTRGQISICDSDSNATIDDVCAVTGLRPGNSLFARARSWAVRPPTATRMPR